MKVPKAKLVDNLEAALLEHLKKPPDRCNRKYTGDLAMRFGVNRKTMTTALLMLAMGEGEENADSISDMEF